MRIAIDLSPLLYSTGVSKYTEFLINSLLEIDTENKYTLFGGSLRRFNELKEKTDKYKANADVKIYPYPPALADFIWNSLHKFPVEKLIGEFDVLHTSDWTEPPSKAFKVTTVHDLYHFKFPKMVHPKILDVHRRKMKWVLKESQRIIVPSVCTKDDLISLGAKEDIIRLIPEAPLLPQVTMEEIEATKKKYQLREDYIYTNGVTVRKNTLNIIKAFNLSKYGKDLKLVLTGRPIGVEIKEERNLRALGHIGDDRELSAIIAGSKGLVFPSLYEGFGLPIVEAFSLGTPVVTSNLGSMKEVAGDAAILVDPNDVNSIADGIEKMLSIPKTLIAKGLKRAKDFTWKKAAEETLKVYNEANEK